MRLLCRLHFTIDPLSNQARECDPISQAQKTNTKSGIQEPCRNQTTTSSKSPGRARRERSSITPPAAPASSSKLAAADNTDECSLEQSHYQLVHHQEQRNAYLNYRHHLQSQMATVSSTSQSTAPQSSSCASYPFLSSLVDQQQQQQQAPATGQLLLTTRLVDHGELSIGMPASGKQDDKQHISSSSSTSSSSSSSASTTNVHDPLLHEQQQQRQRALTTNTTTTTTTTPLSLSSLSSSSTSSTPSSLLNTTTYLSPMTPSNSGGGGGGGGQQASSGLSCKSKRVRTTFTEDQLSILQTHFQIDSNPDGQDLERIATITGLSKRVTQVWFQNSRARQKKYMIKRKPQLGGTANLVAAASFNMAAVASSPMSSLPPQLASDRTFQGTSSPIGSTAAISTSASSTANTNNSDTAKTSNYHQQRFRLPNYSSKENSFDSEARGQQLQLLQGPGGGSSDYVGESSIKGGPRPTAWESGPSAGPIEMADDEVVDEDNENFDGSQSSDEYHLMVSDEDSIEAPTS